jgi:hypothetical protein
MGYEEKERKEQAKQVDSSTSTTTECINAHVRKRIRRCFSPAGRELLAAEAEEIPHAFVHPLQSQRVVRS